MFKHSDLKFFAARDTRGQEHRVCLGHPVRYALVIHSIPGGLFRRSTAEWYSNHAQAERHAEDWKALGYPADIVDAQAVSEATYNTIIPQSLMIPGVHTKAANPWAD